MKEGWSGLGPSARRPPSHPAVPTTALGRDKNTINYPERKGAVRTRPKAAQRSTLATFSECSTKPGSQLSIFTSLCRPQTGLSFSQILQGHL